MFDTPKEFYFELKGQFKNVVFQEGNLIFSYEYGGLKKKMKIISIELIQEKMDDLQLAQAQIQKLKESLGGVRE